MSIDWVTVIAQLANFLLLLWLLRRFLYRPILDGIDAREAAIAKRIAEAEQARKQAEAAEARYVQQYETSLEQQEASVAKALEDTAHERDRLIAETRQQLDDEQAGWQRYLERERDDFIRRLHLVAAETLYELAGKVVDDLADEHLEAAIGRHTVRQLKPLLTELSGAVGAQKQAIVSSHQALSPDLQARLSTDLNHLLPGVEVEFMHNPEQSPGLDIQIGGVQVSWTIDSYLEGLIDAMAERHAIGQHHDNNHHDA